MQLERMPDTASLADAYARAESGDYIEEEAGQRQTAQEVLAHVERLTTPGRLVDLGCWVGFLLAEARARGWDVLGIEPSEFASGFARERLGVDVRTEEIERAQLDPESFDAAVMADVLEHLPDPARALDRVRHALVPGGVLALALPDAGSAVARAMGRRWWSVIPTHLHYFTRDSVQLLLARNGFDPARIATAPKSFTVRYYLDRLGGYNARLARALVSGATAAGVADRPWAPDFRDRMLVLARRRA